ncbi:catalytic, putative [Ricinus communis]|uniref:Catalytic, putative n=2 Tax=Ricinus communis TaxID=3988 RepID=B9RRY1_RICCO|nr:catalytic, putative [Ricinus communis]
MASVLQNNRSSDTVSTINKEGNSGLVSSNSSVSSSDSSASKASAMKKSKKPPTRVFSISQMNDFLRQSRASFNSVRPHWPLEVDQQLMFARSQIENAPGVKNDTVLYAPIYRNVSMFERSYELMENMLKVFIYQEGEKPIFHQSILEGIYASEGWFIKLMEANEKFVTKDPKEAHLFYIPFSSRLLELTLYVRKSHSRNNLIEYMKNYTDMIAAKYPFWSRTGGADHFVAACHDWAPAETRGRMLNCIRALCNADIDVGFRIGKDVSLPETYVRSAQNPLKNLDGNPPSQRPILAFFAGNVHGFVRPILLEYWENKDPEMKIFGPMPRVKGNTNYIQLMKSSKYCICPRGHEVNSPRIVESIFYECVPVIISDNYVPPFFEVLDWESFAVFVLEKDIPNLKKILLSIPEETYVEMHKRVKKVQQHFLWHSEPEKHDLFHMILHSVWYNRVFQTRPA